MATTVKVKVRNGNVTLTFTRWASSRGVMRVQERSQFTMPLNDFQKALDGAMVEVPWKGLL